MAVTAPFGSWTSPISAAQVARNEVWLADVQHGEGWWYWTEIRPNEGGRYAIARGRPGGAIEDVIPREFNARTRVHEYGGGAYLVAGSTVYFCNFTDQRLYRVESGGEPQAITPEPARKAALRYADMRLLPAGSTLVCVRESHEGNEVVNELVVLPTDGSGEPRVIQSGRDFYSYPRPNRDGTRIAWTCWDFPNMPWDGTELWVADLAADGSLSNESKVAGSADESVLQPEWAADDTLYFISDRSNWWNIYRLDGGAIEAVAPIDAEIGGPQWGFGQSYYQVLDDGRIVCIYGHRGKQHLGVIERGAKSITEVVTPFTSYRPQYLAAAGSTVAATAASPTEFSSVFVYDLEATRLEILKRGSEEETDPRYLSEASPVEFPTEHGRTAHALYYPPKNDDYTAPNGEKPPLVVMTHGGPTGQTMASLNLEVQFFTSRGFAVVDVNYGGSTGYGREYRDRLLGQWGVGDLEDCANAARHLVQQGEVDGDRLAIRGGSAGGYTTLCALTFTDVFAVGASYYGLADLETFAGETHKFEARYLDRLVGPYPDAKDLYWERSAANFPERLSVPMVLLQGLEDEIVPPSQAERMIEVLEEKKIPYAYLAFEGEQHGFRKAENIQRSLEAELYFYSKIFGFDIADDIEPLEIKNL